MKRKLVIGISLGIMLLGVTVYSATTNILAVGTIPNSQLFDGPATVTVRTLTIAPGEMLAWHYHPGYAFNVVKSGTLTVEDGCGGDEETLTPGQAFEEMEGRVHRAKNVPKWRHGPVSGPSRARAGGSPWSGRAAASAGRSPSPSRRKAPTSS